MFTGIIQTVGRVVALRRLSSGARITIDSDLERLEIGESISINGACQTVAAVSGPSFGCDILAETLRATNLGRCRAGSKVNLERAMLPTDRLGGHMVSGHVDGVGTVIRIVRRPMKLEVQADRSISRYIVPKGSIAVNGVSLTVGPDPDRGKFEVFIVPYTWENTNLKELRSRSEVNIEVDIIAKYIEAFMQAGRSDDR